MKKLLSVIVLNEHGQINTQCLDSLDNCVGNNIAEILTSDISNIDKTIADSKCDKIAVIDSDCLAHEMWIQSIVSTYTLYNDIGIFGGPIYLMYPDLKPRWIIGYFEYLLNGLDLGHNNTDLSHIPQANPSFSNFSFKKWIWEDVGGVKNSKFNFIKELTNYSHPKKMYIVNMIAHRKIQNNKLNIEWFKKKAFDSGYEMALSASSSTSNKDKTIEDIIHDNFSYDWNSWLTQNHLTDMRSMISHEETTRIYIHNVIKCRIEYFKGIDSFFKNSNIKSYNDIVNINPLFTLKAQCQ